MSEETLFELPAIEENRRLRQRVRVRPGCCARCGQLEGR